MTNGWKRSCVASAAITSFKSGRCIRGRIPFSLSETAANETRDL